MTSKAPSVDVRDNPAKSRFEVHLGDSMAIATYRRDGDVITFTHTKVPEAHEGQGIATALVEAALRSARERGLKVIPQCPFFAAYFERHPEVRDLLAR